MFRCLGVQGFGVQGLGVQGLGVQGLVFRVWCLGLGGSVWSCLCTILRIPANTGHEHTKITSTLPLSLGGLGLRSARRMCVAAHWASWADALPMIQERHPTVADQFVCRLEGVPDSPCLSSAWRAAASLHGVRGWEVPQWSALARGLRPEVVEPDAYQPGVYSAGVAA